VSAPTDLCRCGHELQDHGEHAPGVPCMWAWNCGMGDGCPCNAFVPLTDAPIPYALTPKAIAMLDRSLYVPPLTEDEGQTEGAVPK
jgi:hypothetical protein